MSAVGNRTLYLQGMLQNKQDVTAHILMAAGSSRTSCCNYFNLFLKRKQARSLAAMTSS